MENIFSNKYLHFTTSKKSTWDGFHVMVSTQQCPHGGNVHIIVIIIANAKEQILLQFQGVISIAQWQWATNLCLMNGG